MSGVPGKFVWLRLNLYPFFASALQIIRSIAVSFDRILAIRSLRSRGDSVSIVYSSRLLF